MYFAFDSTKEVDAPVQKDREPSPRNPKNVMRAGRPGRRGAVPRACASCRRRKIKCNGEKPCEACRWYKRPDECVFPQNERDRNSRSSPEPDFRSALTKLIPGTAPEQLIDLPREKLLELITGSASSQMQDSPTGTTSVGTTGGVSVMATDRPTLESLHSIPRDELGEISTRGDAPPPPSSGHISDDVNALSLLARPPTSYLGISCVQAALRAIAWNHPEYNFSISPTVSRQQPDEPLSPLSATLATLQFTESQLVDAYFVNFHPFAPLLDEPSFRRTHQAGSRQDARWLALRDTVLALGSIIASVDVHDRAHCTYFDSAMGHINLSTLGNPSLEVVQTLALMGGWYCHYTSQPNLAYSLMGTALRMALTLGLHRELCDGRSVYEPGRAAYEDFRRRVWWSLCVLETWGQETLGRPGMNFFTASITASPPRLVDKDNYLEILPLIENIEFIKVASKIQESLATPTALTHTEIWDLDAQLLQWWTNLPPIVKDPDTPHPENIYSVRTVIRLRFHTQRMLLFRPTLLNQTMRRIPLIAIRADERTAIQRCRESAETVILDIAHTARAKNMNRMIGWNAVWFLFQATMVPLICLSGIGIFVESTDLEAAAESCKRLVETSILALGRMRPFSPTAGRTFEGNMNNEHCNINEDGLPGPPDAPNGYERMNIDTSIPDRIPLVVNDHAATAAAGGGGGGEQIIGGGLRAVGRSTDEPAGFFDNLPPEYMWEYLSWGPNDLWPDMAALGGQEEAIPGVGEPYGEQLVGQGGS
ncbi:fungal-specific transcription factor domain-containing protein [Aspergillus pseudoustus]|uniref:Fungal-specific transcription factor domain-containing protein n=1 Tax=Aspergillus pseudoustus TaxID=1810923 RepID=A0ABR4JHI5_9EURO